MEHIKYFAGDGVRSLQNLHEYCASVSPTDLQHTTHSISVIKYYRNKSESYLLCRYQTLFNHAKGMGIAGYDEHLVVDAVLSKLKNKDKLCSSKISILQSDRIKDIEGSIAPHDHLILSKIERELKSIN